MSSANNDDALCAACEAWRQAPEGSAEQRKAEDAALREMLEAVKRQHGRMRLPSTTAEELVSTTTLKIWNAIKARSNTPGKEPGFVRTVAYNEALNWLRVKKNRPFSTVELLPEEPPVPASNDSTPGNLLEEIPGLDINKLGDWLPKAIDQITPAPRWVLVKHYMEARPLPELTRELYQKELARSPDLPPEESEKLEKRCANRVHTNHKRALEELTESWQTFLEDERKKREEEP